MCYIYIQNKHRCQYHLIKLKIQKHTLFNVYFTIGIVMEWIGITLWQHTANIYIFVDTCRNIYIKQCVLKMFSTCGTLILIKFILCNVCNTILWIMLICTFCETGYDEFNLDVLEITDCCYYYYYLHISIFCFLLPYKNKNRETRTWEFDIYALNTSFWK